MMVEDVGEVRAVGVAQGVGQQIVSGAWLVGWWQE